MRFLFSTAIIAGLLSASAVALAEAPEFVTIEHVGYAGSGCPAGTAYTSVSPDMQAFTVVYDQYIAQAGPGFSAFDARKFCNLDVKMNFPQGWSFSIVRVSYDGYYKLSPGAMGLQTAKYFFQGDLLHGAEVRSPIVGPAEGNYLIGDTLPLSAVIWSPCGASRNLNIKSQIAVKAPPGGEAIMTNDLTDGEVQTEYVLQWRRCRI